MPKPTPLPHALPDHFRVAHALAAGATSGRLRAGDLSRPFHGVRSRTAASAPDALARAYAPLLRPEEHFSHATALALAGGWVPDRLRREIDVSAVRPVGRPRGAGVRGHEAQHPGGWELDGLPIAPPWEAWCQLAPMLTIRELVIAGDSLVRRRDPVIDLDRLHQAVAEASGRRGVRRLRAAALRVRGRTDSVAETELRLDAEDAGLPEPEVNGEIRDAAGRFVALGDLTYRRQKVLLEYDGEQHRTDDAQFAHDVMRLDRLAHLGWRVIRVTKRHRGAARRARMETVREALAASTRLDPTRSSPPGGGEPRVASGR